MSPNSAFTFIELLIIITILTLLSAASVPLYGNYVEQARIRSDEEYIAGVYRQAEILAQMEGKTVELVTVRVSPRQILITTDGGRADAALASAVSDSLHDYRFCSAAYTGSDTDAVCTDGTEFRAVMWEQPSPMPDESQTEAETAGEMEMDYLDFYRNLVGLEFIGENAVLTITVRDGVFVKLLDDSVRLNIESLYAMSLLERDGRYIYQGSRDFDLKIGVVNGQPEYKEIS